MGALIFGLRDVIMFYRLIPHILKSVPRAHGFVEADLHELLKRIQTLNDTALSGTIIANKDGQRAKLD
jgi:hypothetical protein